jgi:hypothetical protein
MFSRAVATLTETGQNRNGLVTLFDWLSLLSFAISIALPAAGFFARNWIKARIEKGVQHRFDVKIEEVRADLRKNEETLKSELREKEAEITTLRNSVLAGSASRQALLDKRRFEAVEKTWASVNEHGSKLKHISSFVALLKYDEVAKEANEPGMQKLFSVFGAGAPEPSDMPPFALSEQPFVPALVWAYYRCYVYILTMNLTLFRLVKEGVTDPVGSTAPLSVVADRYFSFENLRSALKAALPHQAKFIDENEPARFHYLLDEIESGLLAELQKVLDGREADQWAASKAREVTDFLKRATVGRKHRPRPSPFPARPSRSENFGATHTRVPACRKRSSVKCGATPSRASRPSEAACFR